MCGIGGIFRFDSTRPVDRAALDAMGQAMAHRGPDGAGAWVSDKAAVGLVHRRLAIIDLADNAGQPMSDAEGRVWVAFNGEIYNHLDLRRELAQAGHRFRTDHADTEVLVHGYKEWGVAGLVERLIGMFAFALWDEAAGRLTLVRDRIGIKPLYFAKDGARIVFASEIKAILADESIPREASAIAIYHYLTYLTTPAPLTMFDGIYKLPAGCYVEIDGAGRLAATRYWDAVPGLGETAASAAEAREGVRARLEKAVERRMMSDVPYGAFLSGGIDSSANVALMSRFTDQPVNTFTVGFKDHVHLNELTQARRVAELFSTNHHEVLVDERGMADYLEDLVHSQDEPLADWVCIPLHFVSGLAAQNGVKVIQVGEGSDEQFCGYNGYMKYLRLHRACFRPFQAVFPQALRDASAFFAGAIARAAPAFEIYADAVARAAENREPFWSGAVAFWESQKKPLLPGFRADPPAGSEEMIACGLLPAGYLAPDSFAVAGGFLADFDAAHPGRDQLTRMIHNEFRLRLPELLLMRVDKITMADSLEARVPYLDHELVEYTMNLPMDLKIAGGRQKRLLKETVAGLIPDDIINRPKQGFSAPMADWLRGDFGAAAEARITGSKVLDSLGFDAERVRGLVRAHREGRRDTSLQIWILFNLAAWHDHWIGG